MDKISPSYLYLKGATYYFTRHVPKDIQGHYTRPRIRLCLKTTSRAQALSAAKSISQRLEDYWLALRLSSMDVPALHLVKKHSDSPSDAPLLSAALQTYLRLKGANKAPTFHRAAQRNIQSVINVLGDKPIDQYRSSDAAAFRDYSLERGLSVASVKRNFSAIRSVINLTISEQGIDCRNPFSRVFFPELDDVKARKPIPPESLRSVQDACKQIDDEMRWLIALISDTGLRLAEAAGLAKTDIHTEEAIPYLEVQPHPWRSLKTKGSARKVPLVGSSLWAAQQLLISRDNNTAFAFPRYTDEHNCNAGSASAALNKWLRPRVPEGCVIHSFRHSLRDRLRAVQCPSDIVDQIGGWSSKSVGENYGEGYSLEVLNQWLRQC